MSKARTPAEDSLVGADHGVDTLPAFDGDDTLTGADVLAGEDANFLQSTAGDEAAGLTFPEDIELVVRDRFADYQVGERITDRAAIVEALTHNPAYVVKVAKDAGETNAAESATDA